MPGDKTITTITTTFPLGMRRSPYARPLFCYGLDGTDRALAGISSFDPLYALDSPSVDPQPRPDIGTARAALMGVEPSWAVGVYSSTQQSPS
jgi:hypothetical protein